MSPVQSFAACNVRIAHSLECQSYAWRIGLDGRDDIDIYNSRPIRCRFSLRPFWYPLEVSSREKTHEQNSQVYAYFGGSFFDGSRAQRTDTASGRRAGRIRAIERSAQPQGRKKRVAIFDFDYATVQSSTSALFGTNVDVGKGISDLLVKYLVEDGTYSVIERKAMDKILAEQNFSNSDRANPNSAAKLGKLLGVDAIIVGSITQFGNDTKNTNIGGGGGKLRRIRHRRHRTQEE